MSWTKYLQQGKITQAYQSYIEQPNQDKVTLKTLISLMSVQKHLRAKFWQQACDELIDYHNWFDFLDLQVLQEDLATLKEVSNLLDHHNPEKALESLQKIRSTLYKAELEAQKGTAYIFLNEKQKAKSAFKEALEIDPQHYRALTNLGNIALEENYIDIAIANYEKALSINRNFSSALHNLGVAYRRQGKIYKSIKALRRAQSARQNELKNLSKASKDQAKHWQYVLYCLLVLLSFLWLLFH